ncbi:MAG: D-glycerate dehydrogenase, partial [Devosiaceae bacterium]|nr:D-glycerate dehydrogenase [Devosiaceae bacterium]
MNPKPAKIFVTRRLPDPVEQRMQMLFDATLNEDDIPLSTQQILAGVQSADVIVSTISDQMDKALIGQLPERIKLIAQFGNGVDNIDISAA